MDIRDIKRIATAEEAEEYAKDWQNWQSEQELSYSEIIEWEIALEDLANTFGLYDAFKENGII
jgi:hypothetical protein